MRLVVGLGNPGKKYAKNRHNVGFIVVDRMARKLGIDKFNFSKNAKAEYAWGDVVGEKVELFKPITFVNDSGNSINYAYKKHPRISFNDIYVIHDDLDIKLGNYKIAKGKGPKLHKGILSIEEKLGTDKFWRVRIGVENRSPEKRIPGEFYVLQNFSEEELDILDPVIDNIVEEIHDRLASSN